MMNDAPTTTAFPPGTAGRTPPVPFPGAAGSLSGPRRVRGQGVVPVLVAVANVATELCDPHRCETAVPEWTASGNRRSRRLWVTIQPGLIVQLYDSIMPGLSESQNSTFRAKYRSAPPLRLEALSLHDQIGAEARDRLRDLGLVSRETIRSNIRSIVGAAGQLVETEQQNLLTQLRWWRDSAAVMTGWEAATFAPYVPCPGVDCGRPHTLRINVNSQTGICLACRITWEPGQIGILAEYIRAQSSGQPARTRRKDDASSLT